MLKKSASSVLISKASSTWPRGYASGAFIDCGLAGRPFFEHPACCAPVVPDVQTNEIPACPCSFPAPVNRTMPTNVKFAMAMPSAKRVTRVTHQVQQGIWRVNTMDCGGETKRAPASSLTMSKY
jgi:hypothetical protein